MQPGMLRRAIRRQRKLQHTRARAHTEEHTHTRTHLIHTHTPTRTRTRTHARAHTRTRTHTHTRTLMCAHIRTDTQKQIHTHARGASLGAVAGRDEPQPICVQMRAEAGGNKCTRGCAAVLAQTWAGVSATSACASVCRDVARRFEDTTDRVPREHSRAPAANTMRNTPKRHTHTHTHPRTRAPARASGNGPLQRGVSGNGRPNNTPRGRRRWRAAARAVPGSRERAALPMDA